MRVGKLFREAAERIYLGKSVYSCLALSDAGADSRTVSMYSQVIAPEGLDYVLIADFEFDEYYNNFVDNEVCREHRVIALLMAGQAWNDL